ncbi:hypothetical protein FAM09_21540 [Niastella caeni]|uniref:Uncharacterized protein n=1 Tax=Niastella caeni TaxID=2569763 RepID=A0A4S8HLD7_9BACT|nr:hypothetical protein [Niastella caeni]THU35975.1 hypothetical protein FAM09_21540 [Niastella caeni]
MNFLIRLFRKSKSQITCPRCLGKGSVDKEDIKRLNQELKWRTGRCAYCIGSGRVDPEMLTKVPVDTTYLTTNLSRLERKKLINNDREAMKRAQAYDTKMSDFIKQIIHLHFTGKMDAEQIAEFYLFPKPDPGFKSRRYQKAKEELMDYINRAIELKKSDKLN